MDYLILDAVYANTRSSGRDKQVARCYGEREDVGRLRIGDGVRLKVELRLSDKSAYDHSNDQSQGYNTIFSVLSCARTHHALGLENDVKMVE